MKAKFIICIAICGSFFAALSNNAFGQLLYSENFDDGQATTRWTAQAGVGFAAPSNTDAPMDTNFDRDPFVGGVDGVNDDFSGFAYNYSVAGVPSAPGSAGGSTIGLKLQSSLFSNVLGGFSANPNGLDLDGDYSVSFYVWSSTVGGTAGFPGGGSGSTMLSTFGIMTTGTASETLLSTDGVFFAYLGDSGTASSDFRAYSVDESDSYDPAASEPGATYYAGTRAGSNQLYVDAVGGAITVPQSVKDAFPTQNMEGTLSAGAAGFKWHHNEIRKVGDLVDWYLNGFKLITVDLATFTEANRALMGGNLSFGHSDINYASSIDGLAPDLLFTLIDNIQVTRIVSDVEDADFDADGDVDGRDFLTWQRGFGTIDAVLADGDADGDNDVDADDLVIWQGQYGETGPLVAATAVPEPTSLISFFGAIVAMLGLPRRALSFAPVRTR